MATVTTVALLLDTRSSIGPGQALRLAWMAYVMMLATPFVMFIAVVWRFLSDESAQANRSAGEHWFMISMGFLALAVPLAFFLRGRLWRKYYTGETIEPRRYLTGMMILWSALELGGILSLVGCLLSQSLLPNLVPAMVAFMFFVPFWPSGGAMTRPVGNDEDPQHYEEPR